MYNVSGNAPARPVIRQAARSLLERKVQQIDFAGIDHDVRL